MPRKTTKDCPDKSEPRSTTLPTSTKNSAGKKSHNQYRPIGKIYKKYAGDIAFHQSIPELIKLIAAIKKRVEIENDEMHDEDINSDHEDENYHLPSQYQKKTNTPEFKPSAPLPQSESTTSTTTVFKKIGRPRKTNNSFLMTNNLSNPVNHPPKNTVKNKKASERTTITLEQWQTWNGLSISQINQLNNNIASLKEQYYSFKNNYELNLKKLIELNIATSNLFPKNVAFPADLPSAETTSEVVMNDNSLTGNKLEFAKHQILEPRILKLKQHKIDCEAAVKIYRSLYIETNDLLNKYQSIGLEDINLLNNTKSFRN